MKIGVLKDFTLEKFDEVEVVIEDGLHIGQGPLLLEILEESLDITIELEHIVANIFDHSPFVMQFDESLGIPDFSLFSYLFEKVVENLEFIDLKMHLQEFEAVIL